jgi:hypothetical protein
VSWPAWYVAIGVLTLIVILVAARMPNQEESDLHKQIQDALHPEFRAWHWKLINKLVIPALTCGLVVVLWPLAIFLKCRVLFEARRPAPTVEEKPFEVSRSDLQTMLSVAEIEARERVFDPMQAVPDLAFGHLHEAWQGFKHGLQPGDEIWSFSARWTTWSGRDELPEGYAIVKATGMGSHFLTGRRYVEDV